MPTSTKLRAPQTKTPVMHEDASHLSRPFQQYLLTDIPRSVKDLFSAAQLKIEAAAEIPASSAADGAENQVVLDPENNLIYVYKSGKWFRATLAFAEF